MKLRYLKFIILILLSPCYVFGQNARFVKSGIIEFEKSVNIHAIVKRLINKDNEYYYGPALEQYKKSQPQFKKLKSTLTFANNKTLFVPEASSLIGSMGFFNEMPMVSQHNTIYTDLSGHQRIIQKKAFEESFLLRDSTHKIKWKITSETREIAGYQCRRANAIILDSVYVVAFYTDQIPVSGGPESFNGLPGMILGLALPHDNVTWFATKVTDTSVTQNTLIPPGKGKAVTNKEFFDKLSSAMKDWGSTFAKSALIAFSL